MATKYRRPETWLDRLEWLSERFSHLGPYDLEHLSQTELWGVYCFLSRKYGEQHGEA